MHRAFLLKLLAEYAQRYPQEEEVAARMVEFVSEHSACFKRELSAGHITGSAWLVNDAGTHVLLTHHKKLNAWFQLGGHSDGEPDTSLVALREAREESGLTDIEAVSSEPAIFDIDIHPIPARKDEPEHFHYDVRFAFKATSTHEYVVSDESHDLAWVAIAEIAEYTTEESMKRMARKWREYRDQNSA